MLSACSHRPLVKKTGTNLRYVTMMRLAVTGIDKRSKSTQHPIIVTLRLSAKLLQTITETQNTGFCQKQRSPIWKNSKLILVFCTYGDFTDWLEPGTSGSAKSLYELLQPGYTSLCFSHLYFPNLLNLFIKDCIEFKLHSNYC